MWPWKKKPAPEDPRSHTIEVIDASDDTCEYDCGHTGPWSYGLLVYGQKFSATHTWKDCPNCAIQTIAEKARCGKCGLEIPYDTTVTEWPINDPAVKFADVAIKTDDQHVMGCYRDDCRPTEGDPFAGWMTLKGFRRRPSWSHPNAPDCRKAREQAASAT